MSEQDKLKLLIDRIKDYDDCWQDPEDFFDAHRAVEEMIELVKAFESS